MGKSSKDKRDRYYRKAKEEGWRARSAYKLLQLDEEFHFLDGFSRVVDLCAAPGSWSQVLSQKAQDRNPKIIAVDLQPMAPISGVITIQADITHPSTVEKILNEFDGKEADLVVSDGAPDVTGLHDLDEYVQAQLIHSALSLATRVLRKDGIFIAKIFRGRDVDLIYAQLGRLFKKVTCSKPRSSRASSLEAFIVCEGYVPRPGWNPLENESTLEALDPAAFRAEAAVTPFLACGDLSSYDADATYSDTTGKSRDPVRPPTAPPYKIAAEMRRQGLY